MRSHTRFLRHTEPGRCPNEAVPEGRHIPADAVPFQDRFFTQTPKEWIARTERNLAGRLIPPYCKPRSGLDGAVTTSVKITDAV
jgi:hypothetical protein